MRRLVLAALVLAVLGCAAGAHGPKQGTPEWSRMTERTYAVSGSQCYAATLAGYQDLGAVISTSDAAGGLLVGRVSKSKIGFHWDLDYTATIAAVGADSTRLRLRVDFIAQGDRSVWDNPPTYAGAFAAVEAHLSPAGSTP